MIKTEVDKIQQIKNQDELKMNFMPEFCQKRIGEIIDENSQNLIRNKLLYELPKEFSSKVRVKLTTFIYFDKKNKNIYVVSIKILNRVDDVKFKK